MKSEAEIIERINLMNIGIKEDQANKKEQDAIDKALYVTALRWVLEGEASNGNKG